MQRHRLELNISVTCLQARLAAAGTGLGGGGVTQKSPAWLPAPGTSGHPENSLGELKIHCGKWQKNKECFTQGSKDKGDMREMQSNTKKPHPQHKKINLFKINTVHTFLFFPSVSAQLLSIHFQQTLQPLGSHPPGRRLCFNFFDFKPLLPYWCFLLGIQEKPVRGGP